MPGFKPAAKGGGAKASGKPSGHAPTGKGSGGCGTGAGGFKAGNTCGHKGNRNAKVESARAAHTAAKAEVLKHVQAHRKASKAAAKSGEKAAHPKELHAALKKAAAAHATLKAARDTHKAEQRSRRNAARREAHAVKAGRAQPLSARPAPPTRTGQAKAAPTDKGATADRLGVAAARHRRIASSLNKRADGLRNQADKLAGGMHGHGVAAPMGGSRGRGLGGAPVGAGSVRELPRGASDLGYAAAKLAGRARHHGTRALELEGAARKAKVAAKVEPSKDVAKAPEFKPAGTIAEAHDYLKSKGIEPHWHADGYRDHDYRANLDHANEVHSALHPLIEKYPEAKPSAVGSMYAMDLNRWNGNLRRNMEIDRQQYEAKGKRWREPESVKRVTRSMIDRPSPESDGQMKYDIFHGGEYHSDSGRLRLNHRNVVIQSREKSEENRASDLARGRPLSGVGSSYREIAQHEMGHAIHYKYGIHEHPEMIALHASHTPDQIKHGLSDYATTNIKEFIAEGFTEGLRPDARPMGRKVKSLIDKLVDEHRSKAK